jgi:predicted SAM-dependent methyltransferase
MKLNLGCGDVAPPEWVNVDFAIGARLRKIPFIGMLSRRFLRSDWNPSIVVHDLRTRFPWPDSSVDIVYSSHSLEHLTRRDGERFMRETFRVLRVGGIVRIVVPDLKREVDRYLSGAYSARDFISALNVSDFIDAPFIKRVYGMLSGQGHRCMYDEESLCDLMTASGFAVVCKAPFESDIPGIADIEGVAQTDGALILEGYKRAA